MVSTLPHRESQAGDVLAARSRLLVEEDEHGWKLTTSDAREGARLRRTFRTYLEHYGHPASDFDAAEAVYGELVNNCVHHAPGPLAVTFLWDERTLTVVDSHDRLRLWPFSDEDASAEATHHAYSLISAYTGRIHLTRNPGGGTRTCVVLPVMRAGDASAAR
ncbi:MAG TPA: ATP-binding protein [Candidatus Elarobacter sp.]|jgi:hypothetical protein|nr:ATP-binding protein [Candidatus Elarobacter sp.]